MGAASTASPAKVGPPPLTIDDLDRDELVELVRRAHFLQRPRDLWWVRWYVASERATAALRRESAAYEEAHAAFSAVMARQGKATRAERARWAAAQVERDRAIEARARADRREARAWAALEAC